MDDLILRYLQKEMEAEEAEAFEKRLETDPAWAQALEDEIRARTAVAASAYLDRKEKLKARPIHVSASVKPLYARPVSWAVAAVVVLLLAFVAIQFLNKPLSHEELFAQNYTSVPFPTARGTAGDAFLQARQAYQEGDFQEVITELDDLLADSSFTSRPQAYYFRGLSQLELDDPTAAIASFEQVSENAVFGQGARWHTALAYLKTGQQEEAKKALQQLLEGPGNTYQAQARILLPSLD